MSVFKVSQSGVGFLHGLISLGTVTSKLASMAAARVVSQYAPYLIKTAYAIILSFMTTVVNSLIIS